VRALLSLAAVLTLAAPPASRAQDAPGGISSVEISAEGRQVYVEVCQACHMAGGRGGGEAGFGIPALAGNPNLADKDLVIGVLVNGRGGMPWFTDILSAAQMAAVLTYVRNDFNAYGDPITTAEVERAIGNTVVAN